MNRFSNEKALFIGYCESLCNISLSFKSSSHLFWLISERSCPERGKRNISIVAFHLRLTFHELIRGDVGEIQI